MERLPQKEDRALLDDFLPLRRLLAAGLLGLGVWILWRYIPALLWALVISFFTWPVYQRVFAGLPEERYGAWRAGLFTFLVAVLLLLPLVVIGIRIAGEAQTVVHWIRSAQREGIPTPDWLVHVPLAGASLVTWWQTHLADAASLSDWLRHANTGPILEWSRSLGSVLLSRLLTLACTLLTIYFLYRHGNTLAADSLAVIRRSLGEAGERYAFRAIAAVRGTLNGLVLVALGEAVLFAIVYAVAGLPHPALLGGLTGLFGMIPFGAPIVFGAGAVVLSAQGFVTAAVGVLVFGFVVLFVADHLIRPVLIGGAARLPFLWVLLGILGGLETLGLLGLFIGPAVLATLISLWRDLAEAAKSRSAMPEAARHELDLRR